MKRTGFNIVIKIIIVFIAIVVGMSFGYNMAYVGLLRQMDSLHLIEAVKNDNEITYKFKKDVLEFSEKSFNNGKTNSTKVIKVK